MCQSINSIIFAAFYLVKDVALFRIFHCKFFADFILTALLLSLSSFVAAADGAALVIGNQSYSFMQLETPRNDAEEFASRLQASGFDAVVGIDLQQAEMYEMVDSFFEKFQDAKVLIVYYAGHAVQMNGKNFLIPIDVKNKSSDILSQLFDIGYIISKFQASKSGTRILILDACRDTLFSKSPNAASGLAELKAPPGTLVAFSTMPGATAEDGEGRHSPYTEAILELLFQTGLKIEDAFKEVRKRVMHTTNGAQIPTESSSLLNNFVFNLGTPPKPSSSVTKNRQPALVQKPLSKADGVVGSQASTSVCSRLMTKLSIGLSPLTTTEKSQLSQCH